VATADRAVPGAELTGESAVQGESTQPIHLDSFLGLGFFLDVDSGLEIDVSRIDPAAWAAVPEDRLITEFAERFRNAVASRMCPGMRYVVPLSGGLDSRAILATLAEGTEVRNVETFTFGSPGSYDYELGCDVARRTGTKHTAYPLTEHVYTLDELVCASRRMRHQTVLFHHPPLEALAEQFGAGTIWSGFLGDTTTKLRGTSEGDAKARLHFLAENRYVTSTNLMRGPESSILAALEVPTHRRTALPLEEDLNLEYRQKRFIAPHVLAAGFGYETPFSEPELLGFLMSLPPERRANQSFYVRALAAVFPDWFQFATKTSYGLPIASHWTRKTFRRAVRRARKAARRIGLRYADPMLNYLDFAAAIRERTELRELVRSSVADLAGRRLLAWLDPEALLDRHLSGARDHSDALLVLTSLEIHLKAGMELP
jgi:hypothetical protein